MEQDDNKQDSQHDLNADIPSKPYHAKPGHDHPFNQHNRAMRKKLAIQQETRVRYHAMREHRIKQIDQGIRPEKGSYVDDELDV